MQNKLKKRIIIAAVLAAIIIGGFLAAKVEFVKDAYAIDRYNKFWDDPGEYDVWFMGSSHMYYSVQPMMLWDEYGIKSYDIACQSSTLALTYWTLMCGLRQATPDAVVVDVYHIDMDYKVVNMRDKVHRGFDAVPLSMTKAQAVNDLFETIREKREYLFPIYRKDGPWKETIKKDKKYHYSLTKGAMLGTKIVDLTGVEVTPSENMLSKPTVNTIYLQKIIDECKKRNITLIVTAFPYADQDIKERGLHTGIQIAKENEVPVIDLCYCPELLNYKCEFCVDGHPNVSGSVKTTRYVGAYLSTKHNIADHREDGDTSAAYWEKENVEYKKMINKKIRKEEDLATYMLYMKYERLKPYVYMKDSHAAGGKKSRAVIDNTEDKEIISYEEAKEMMGEDFRHEAAVIVVDTENDEVVDQAYFNKGKRIGK